MNTYTDDNDHYEIYEEHFNLLHSDRRARRQRRPKPHHQPKKSHEQQLAETAETIGLEGGFQTTYRPSKHESGWLMQSLREFYQQELISDVEALVKGGKEANVYRCKAHPATGETWLAAKVYRPRMFRNLRNDHRYRVGRTTLLPDGRPVKGSDRRLKKALAGKTAFGQQLSHISWLMHEYNALRLLYEAGGDVPRPLAASENAILMGYVGDDRMAAPALNEISLGEEEARRLFTIVMRNIDLMLAYGRVHGDLSAYNILYWAGSVTLIDFPQIINSEVSRATHPLDSAANPDAYDILARDIQRVCDYFSEQGAPADAQRLLATLWNRHVADSGTQRLADASRWQEEPA